MISRIGLTVILAAIFCTTTSAVSCAGTMTPELAARKEMVRKQQDQRITNEKRKAAAAALKAERLRIYDAKQEALKAAPSPS